MTRTSLFIAPLVLALGCSPEAVPDSTSIADDAITEWVDSLTDEEVAQAAAIVGGAIQALDQLDVAPADRVHPLALAVLDDTSTALAALGHAKYPAELYEVMVVPERRTVACVNGHNVALETLQLAEDSQTYADAADDDGSVFMTNAQLAAWDAVNHTLETVYRADDNLTDPTPYTFDKLLTLLAAGDAVRYNAAATNQHLVSYFLTGNRYYLLGFYASLDAVGLAAEAEDELADCYIGL